MIWINKIQERFLYVHGNFKMWQISKPNLLLNILFFNFTAFHGQVSLLPSDATNRELFSESCQIKPNLNCKYHFPIEIWPQTELRLVPNQSEKCYYNPNLIWFNKIQKKILGLRILVKFATWTNIFLDNLRALSRSLNSEINSAPKRHF